MITDGRQNTYVLSFRAVQDCVPSVAGVYTVFTPHRLLHVGDTFDLRDSLFQQLHHPPATWAAERQPLSFSFESRSPAEPTDLPVCLPKTPDGPA